MKREEGDGREDETKMVALPHKPLHVDEGSNATTKKSVPGRTKLCAMLIRQEEEARRVVNTVAKMNESLGREKSALLLGDEIAEGHGEVEMAIRGAARLLERILKKQGTATER